MVKDSRWSTATKILSGYFVLEGELFYFIFLEKNLTTFLKNDNFIL